MAGKEINERTIETKIQGEASPRYSTNITNTGDIVNQFPNQTPAQNDLYCARHTQLVDGVLSNRQATIDKIIDTVGTAIKGMINPASFSPVDLIKLIDTFREITAKKSLASIALSEENPLTVSHVMVEHGILPPNRTKYDEMMAIVSDYVDLTKK